MTSFNIRSNFFLDCVTFFDSLTTLHVLKTRWTSVSDDLYFLYMRQEREVRPVVVVADVVVVAANIIIILLFLPVPSKMQKNAPQGMATRYTDSQIGKMYFYASLRRNARSADAI